MDERIAPCAWDVLHEQRHREENQDSWIVLPAGPGWLLSVCDGMGGVRGGARASLLAAQTLSDFTSRLPGEQPGQVLVQAIMAANARILKEARADFEKAGMGTTMVCAYVQDRQVHVAWAGDSRAGIWHPEHGFRWLTTDHTRVQELVDMGLIPVEQAHDHPYGHILSRAVGVSAELQADTLAPFTLQEGEVLLLCSDGVSGACTDLELELAMSASTSEDTVDTIHDTVEAADGSDNATAVIWMPDAPFIEHPRPRRLPPQAPEPTERMNKGLDKPYRRAWIVAAVLSVLALLVLAAVWTL